MLLKSVSKCLQCILRKSTSYKASPLSSKCFGFNGGSHRKSFASLFWKVSTFFVVADCATSEAQASKQKQLQLPEPVDLNSLSLIQRAATVTVDAATQLLTQTVTAIMERSEAYRNGMEQMIQLMEESIRQSNNSLLQEHIRDQLIEIRNELKTAHEELQQLESFMEYVIKLGTNAADASYLAGAEFACTTMCDRLDSAQQLLSAEYLKIKEVQDIYLKTNEKFVINYTETPPDSGKGEA